MRVRDGKGKNSVVVSAFYFVVSAFATFTLLLMNRHFIMSIMGSNSHNKGSSADFVPKAPTSDMKDLQASTNINIVSTEAITPQSTNQSISQAPFPFKVMTKHDLVTQSQSTSSATKPSITSILDSSIICPAEVANNYNRVPGSGGSSADDNMVYCKRQQSSRHVLVGRSWGSLSKGEQMEWDKRKCNELLTMGKLQTCSEQWGWRWFDNWKSNQRQVMERGSNVTCIIDYKTTSYCTVSFPSQAFLKLFSSLTVPKLFVIRCKMFQLTSRKSKLMVEVVALIPVSSHYTAIGNNSEHSQLIQASLSTISNKHRV